MLFFREGVAQCECTAMPLSREVFLTSQGALDITKVKLFFNRMPIEIKLHTLPHLKAST